jgi:hypothetical protein
MRVWKLMLAALTLTAGAARAQEAGAGGREAMRRLAFLEGEWEGEAWIESGPGERRRLRQTETVRYSNSGHVLVIQGTGWESEAGGAERMAFNAVAVVSHAADAGYRMRSYTMEGRTGDFELTVSDSGFVWGMEFPAGRVRYTMRLTPEGEWREVGEFFRGEAPGRTVIELRVRKKQ